MFCIKKTSKSDFVNLKAILFGSVCLLIQDIAEILSSLRCNVPFAIILQYIIITKTAATISNTFKG